ncbi:MAG: prepilin-type N-terminal cleavage/methylation domain-containing protein [Campylobacterota bacterium]|nr:prepilin-type N-terminal cleavage/methylation domain-containing protein [Campylobacterota bacterium]
MDNSLTVNINYILYNIIMNKKNSFTLFEILISLVIFAIVLSGVQKLFVDDNAISIYYELQELENDFTSTKTIGETSNIKFQQH